MIVKLALGAGFSGAGLQIFLQVYQARHPNMDGPVYWGLLILSGALILLGIAYLVWEGIKWLRRRDEIESTTPPGIRIESRNQRGGFTGIANIGRKKRGKNDAQG